MRTTSVAKVFGASLAALVTALGLSGSVQALDVNIAESLPYVDVLHDGKRVRIQRIQDEENVLTSAFAKTSRKCPPFCIHAMVAAPGVTTAGELELLDFVKNQVAHGSGLLLDARTPEWYTKGTIPGSVNIPFTVFGKEANKAELLAALETMGVKPKTPTTVDKAVLWLKRLIDAEANENALNWDFSKAKSLLLWCNGPWCDQSPRAIKGLLKLGYPADKMYYYRGGMQLWQILGLTVVVPGAEVAPQP